MLVTNQKCGTVTGGIVGRIVKRILNVSMES